LVYDDSWEICDDFFFWWHEGTLQGRIKILFMECQKVTKKVLLLNGNTAARNIAYAISEEAAIYPITPLLPEGSSLILGQRRPQEPRGKKVKIHGNASRACAAGAVSRCPVLLCALTTTIHC
jgi:hypothetical protein